MSRIAAVGVLVGALFVTPGAETSEAPQARTLVAEAERDLAAGTITAQQFLSRCDEAARTAPDDAAGQLCLGTAWLLLNDDARAEGCFERAHALDPSSKMASYWLATLSDRRGERDRARALYEQALALPARDDDDREMDARTRAWLAGTPPEADSGFVTAEDVSCFWDGTCPQTRQIEIVRIAPRSDGQCEQRLMLKIPFDLDRSTLSGAARKQLDELGRALAAGVAGDAALRMVGYASPEGEEDYNLELSRRRVDAVEAYLVERWGVPAPRIETTAVGESEPVRNSDGSVNHERSRRVELVRGLGAVPCGDGAGS